MSFWKSLFGGGAGEERGTETSGASVDYKGYVVRAAPYRDGDQYQTAGTIEKEIGGERKQHRFIRADRHASHEQAVAFTLDKARQIIDLQGDRLFE